MARADAMTIASGTPGRVLMERAGAALAEAARRLASVPDRVLVLCGPGNNGGDGYVAARLLAAEGFDVAVASLGPSDALTGDAAYAFGSWPGPVLPIEDAVPEEAAIVIDALFGAGLGRDLEGSTRKAVERLNAAGRPVLSVDLPSGIDGETGAVRGIAVRATRTVTFAARKPGHLMMPGRAHCGPVEVVDIGIAPETIASVAPDTYANGPALWSALLPWPSLEAHKYQRGHTLVVSGGATRTGAARLAARAALRIGSGLVTLACPPEALGVAAAQVTAVMLRGCDGAEGLAAILEDQRLNTVVLGPALGVHAATRTMVTTAIAARRNLVLDADALTSFEGYADALAGAFTTAPTVMTPHEGEFRRLLKGRPEILELPSKLERARRAATHLGATIIYKGPDTVIAEPGGRAAINENGSPYLATAGSGDVLAGLIGGLMAQGVPSFEAACAAVWIHGAAGAGFGAGLIAEDIPDLVPPVLRQLGL
jgi:NAD(P)H-hydrate epimerase